MKPISPKSLERAVAFAQRMALYSGPRIITRRGDGLRCADTNRVLSCWRDNKANRAWLKLHGWIILARVAKTGATRLYRGAQ